MNNNTFSIIGGGIGGLSIALTLLKKGIRPVIYERQPRTESIDTGIVLGANALKSLDYLGLGKEIRMAGYSQDSCTIYSETGKVLTELNYEETSHPNYTFISRTTLTDILAAALPPDIIKYNKKLLDFSNEQDEVTLFFEDGTKAHTDYMIACDGLFSNVRQKLLPEKEVRFAGYTCWRGVSDVCPDSIPKRFTETWGPKGRIGLVPLKDNKMYWYVFKNSEAKNPEFNNWNISDIFYNFIGYHYPVPHVLELTQQKNIFHHDIHNLDPIFQYFFGRVLLAGDSAHPTTPNMGQGACQAIEDALVLGTCFETTDNVEEAFSEFEVLRVHKAKKVVQDSWMVGKVAQIDIPFLASIRNTVVKLTPTTVYTQRMKNIFEVDRKN